MEWILSIATILGGISAIWFLFDKRNVISAWFKLRISASSINPLGLSDDEFLFFHAKINIFLSRAYFPIDAQEEATCRSLVNQGVFTKNWGKYRLSSAGRKLLYA